MAKFIVVKQIDFGNFTILGKSGLQSDQVPINTFAPKVGDIVEGNLETKPVPDGNGNSPIKTGIDYLIMTNGSASTTGQTSLQFITIDNLQPVNGNTGTGTGSGSGSGTGSGTSTSGTGTGNTNTPADNWSIKNILSGLALIAGVILVIWGASKVNTDKEDRGIMYMIIGVLLLVIHFIFPVKVSVISKP